MIGVGLYVIRFNSTASEYFRGGSRIPWLVAGLSSFMSGFSAWTFTGGAGVAYKSGIVVIGLYLGNALCYLLGYYVFASRWRRTRISTVMEYLADRFGPTTHQTFSWATIIFQIFTSATMLYGLSLFVSTACQFSVTATILVTGCVILFYSVVGGSGPSWLRTFCRRPFSCRSALCWQPRRWYTSAESPGWSTRCRSDMKTIPLHGEFGWIYLACWTVMVSFGYNTAAMAQRYFSVEDERAAKRVALLCAGLFFLGAFLWFIPPMAMRVVYPDLHAIWPHLANPNEASYVAASLTLLAARPHRRHARGDVQRHDGESLRQLQSQIRHSFEGYLPDALSTRARRARAAHCRHLHDAADRRRDDSGCGHHGFARRKHLRRHDDLQHPDLAFVRSSRAAWVWSFAAHPGGLAWRLSPPASRWVFSATSSSTGHSFSRSSSSFLRHSPCSS